jgi:hypothetical protein
VAFRHAYYEDGVPQLPVVTGIQYGGWYDTAEAMVRDVTQVNPVRRSIAVQADFRVPSEHMEDWSYVEAVRPLLRTQEDAGRVMYHYFHSSSDSNQGRLAPHTFDLPLQVGSPAFRWVTV